VGLVLVVTAAKDKINVHLVGVTQAMQAVWW
jgi:hypothetical protein